MADEMKVAGEQGEQQEDQVLQQILQMCESGNPAVLPQIAEAVKGLLAHNEQEESEISGGETEPSTREKMLAAVKGQMGE